MNALIQNGTVSKVPVEDHAFIGFSDWLKNPTPEAAIDVASDTNPAELISHLENFSAIRIAFPTSADGRGNSIAKSLRRAGFRGYLRAAGHIHADQYPLALRCGFDDVEISAELAARQPQVLWQDALERLDGNYFQHLTS